MYQRDHVYNSRHIGKLQSQASLNPEGSGKGKTSKLNHPREGPVIVIKRLNDIILYRVKLGPNKTIKLPRHDPKKLSHKGHVPCLSCRCHGNLSIVEAHI